MKQTFTLCTLGALLLFNTYVFSQTNEHFENDSVALAANCWQFIDMRFATNSGPTSGYLINGNGSLFADPPVSASAPRIVRTPLLNVGSSISIAFYYKLSTLLKSAQTRQISVDLVNNYGTTVQNLATINMSQSTNNSTSAKLFSQTFSVNTPGMYRLAITINGSTGGGNARISIDDLSQNANVIGCMLSLTLPVNLISFSGNLNNNKISLQWAVAENENNDHFEVEKSADGNDFTTAAIVMASSKPGTESYSINEPMKSGRIYYRLRMFDNNKVVTFSKTLVFDTKITTDSKQLKVVNNPAVDKLSLTFESTNDQPVRVKVYDLTGRIQIDQKINVYQGNNLITLPLSSFFKTGMYAVEVSSGSERQTAKFVKQ